MCGIVGYIGTRQAYPILISGLHRLEYRGYDSAGVALLGEGDGQQQIAVYKAKGKVSALEEAAKDKDCTGTIGIAHTRWAHPWRTLSGQCPPSSFREWQPRPGA